MPPKALSGAAGRAKRKHNAQVSELNLDTAGASDALAASLLRLATAALEFRQNGKGYGTQSVCGYTIRRRQIRKTVTIYFSHTVCARVEGYGSIHAVVASAIEREQAARTIGELKPEGLDIRSYRAMPIDSSRPPSLRHGRPDASVAAAARTIAAPAAALYALAGCCDPAATVVVVEHAAGKGPTDPSDLRKFMSNCAVGGDIWSNRDKRGTYDWVVRSADGRGGLLVPATLRSSLSPSLSLYLRMPLHHALAPFGQVAATFMWRRNRWWFSPRRSGAP